MQSTSLCCFAFEQARTCAKPIFEFVTLLVLRNDVGTARERVRNQHGCMGPAAKVVPLHEGCILHPGSSVGCQRVPFACQLYTALAKRPMRFPGVFFMDAIELHSLVKCDKFGIFQLPPVASPGALEVTRKSSALTSLQLRARIISHLGNEPCWKLERAPKGTDSCLQVSHATHTF